MAEENELPLPSLGLLPLWAQVAFAARCARRVLPFVECFWPDAPDRHLRSLTFAVASAEAAADTTTVNTKVGRITAARDAATKVARASSSRVASNAAARAADAAMCALKAACWANDLKKRYSASTFRKVRSSVGDATKSAVFAACAISKVIGIETYNAIVADYNLVVHLSNTQHWTDATPVPPSVFGPLWPEGAPEGWPAIEEETVTPSVVVEAETTATNTAKPTEKPKRLGVNLQFLVRGDVPADEIAQDIFELYAAMNEQNLAHGGPGLTIEEFRFLIGSPVGAGVR